MKKISLPHIKGQFVRDKLHSKRATEKLAALLRKVTPKNIHTEILEDSAVGKEIPV